MECLPVSKLPTGSEWTWEIKLDGYRALAVKSQKVTLFSRTKNSLNEKFPYIVAPLNALPPNTVIDGELVALDEHNRPQFQLLQKFRSASSRIHYHVFDILRLEGRDITALPLSQRRKLLHSLKFDSDRITIVDSVEADSHNLLAAAKKQNLEGIIGKLHNSVYEPGQRTGAWIKFRLNHGQEFVIGGYTPGPQGFDAIAIGYYKGKDLIYVARIRNGFVPASRKLLFEKMCPLQADKCPFVNLPETHKTRWGEGFTADKLKKAVWLRPLLVAQIEFLEWTGSDHLRHAKFIALRDDKKPAKVVKES